MLCFGQACPRACSLFPARTCRPQAFERLLEYHPEWRGKVVLIQVGAPLCRPAAQVLVSPLSLCSSVAWQPRSSSALCRSAVLWPSGPGPRQPSVALQFCGSAAQVLVSPLSLCSSVARQPRRAPAHRAAGCPALQCRACKRKRWRVWHARERARRWARPCPLCTRVRTPRSAMQAAWLGVDSWRVLILGVHDLDGRQL